MMTSRLSGLQQLQVSVTSLRPPQPKRLASLQDLPTFVLLIVLQYLSAVPGEFGTIALVCKAWNERFSCSEAAVAKGTHEDAKQLWRYIANDLKIECHFPSSKGYSTKSSNFKKLMLTSYAKMQKNCRDKHEQLLLAAKTMLEKKVDCPAALEKLILKFFPLALQAPGVSSTVALFNVNFQSNLVEKNW